MHIIDRDDDDFVDALGLERVKMVQIAGKVVVLAGWGKRAWHRKQNNFAAFENLIRRTGAWAVCGWGLEGEFWQLLANGDGHCIPP